MARKSIGGKDILKDIRAGIDDAGLMEKYGLSAKGILQLMGRLVSEGLLSPSELAARKSLAKTVYFPLFKCPKCNEVHYTKFERCPKCGALMTHLNKPSDSQ